MTAFILAWSTSTAVRAQLGTAPSASSLAFDGVTVVDVEQGKLISGQRVVIVGHRIQAVGSPGAVSLPPRTQVVNARGKYLIPGLWDMHRHIEDDPADYASQIMAGVTGIRDPGSRPPLDSLLQWRREILAGTRVGPPRQIFSGITINSERPDCQGSDRYTSGLTACVTNVAEAVHLVDSLKAAGADMIKARHVNAEIYFAIAAEARRLGIPFGGHVQARNLTVLEASDSGASIIDHIAFHVPAIGTLEVPARPDPCLARRPSDTVEPCRPVAERLRRNGTWWVPTLSLEAGQNPYYDGNVLVRPRFGAEAYSRRRQELDELNVAAVSGRDMLDDSPGLLSIAHEIGLPILAGTDMRDPYAIQLELAMYVAEGLTPLEALQTATLNPAKFLHATDSLGTVTAGKLADLVLLDADPLQDIWNTVKIRAVVANGHYYDRAALDGLVSKVRDGR